MHLLYLNTGLHYINSWESDYKLKDCISHIFTCRIIIKKRAGINVGFFNGCYAVNTKYFMCYISIFYHNFSIRNSKVGQYTIFQSKKDHVLIHKLSYINITSTIIVLIINNKLYNQFWLLFHCSIIQSVAQYSSAAPQPVTSKCCSIQKGLQSLKQSETVLIWVIPVFVLL